MSSLFELKDDDKIVMRTIVKKLQDMSRNRSFLIIEVRKIVRLLLLSQGTSAESDGIAFASKRVKTYLRSTMRNNRLHVYNNILHNINLADVANQFVDRKDSRKQRFKFLAQKYS